MSANSPPAVYRSASYLACADCGEGTLVWDAEAGESTCSHCGG